jgi:hypothetical protein
MTGENRKRERFRKYIGRHVRCGYPGSRKGTIKNVVVNKMMPYIDVLGTSRYRWRVREGTSSLIIAKDGERTRDREFKETKQNTHPKRLLKCMGHGVVLSLS